MSIDCLSQNEMRKRPAILEQGPDIIIFNLKGTVNKEPRDYRNILFLQSKLVR